MNKKIKNDIGDTIVELSQKFDNELMQDTKEELERHWHFEWQDIDTLEENIYNFYKMLKLYGNFCRRWEENKNGSTCVVERVRDEYLSPKIIEFANQIRMRAMWI